MNDRDFKKVARDEEFAELENPNPGSEVRKEKPTLTEVNDHLGWLQFSLKRIYDVMEYFLHDSTLDELDERVKPVLAPIFKVSFVLGVSWFIYYYYITEQSSHFVSLKMESGQCKEVPLPITHRYFIDNHGWWFGDTNFSLSHAKYSFDMEGFFHSNFEFTEIIGTTFRQKIERFAANAINRSLTDNLLYWMNWSEYIYDGHVKHRIQMTGSVPSVFHRHSFNARLSDADIMCNLSSKVRYSMFEASFRIDYDASDYHESEHCMHVLAPENWEYHPRTDFDEFHLSLEVKSLTTVVALNHHVLGLEMLEQVDHHDRGYLHYEHEGFDTYYHLTYYTDERYEEVEPFICFIAEAHSEEEREALENGTLIDYFCATDHGKILGIPFLTQMGPEGSHGYSQFVPVECTCDGGSDATALLEECQRMNLVIGEVFFQNISTGAPLSFDEQFLHIMRMEYLIKLQQTHLNHLVYNATFAAITLGGEAYTQYNFSNISEQEQTNYDLLHGT